MSFRTLAGLSIRLFLEALGGNLYGWPECVHGVMTACTCRDGFGALRLLFFYNGLKSSSSFSLFCQRLSPGTDFCCQVVHLKGRSSFLFLRTMGGARLTAQKSVCLRPSPGAKCPPTWSNFSSLVFSPLLAARDQCLSQMLISFWTFVLKIDHCLQWSTTAF
jgi:hypothetical protein